MLNIRHLVSAILLLLHNGLIKILTESRDFYELEKRISELSQRVSSANSPTRDGFTGTRKQETKFFLDELLGLPSNAKMTPRLREIAAKLSTEMSFRRVADILSQLFLTISFMTIWKVKEEIGEEIQQHSKEKRKEVEVVERGGSPKGEKEAKVINIEGDGVIVNLQKSEKKKGEIKHIVVYEGKREVRKPLV